ncbi:Isopentenyl-diphosphate delta-isomerase [Chlamydia abortus]|uniref:Isopentenyl-diphosphate delta-isomerase n=1 Tax=Paenibacillus residui TaxID=629724 RepID=A0ABW3DAZ7_9BACL|nr:MULTISPECIES: type 2 isopentenyl-diphosphate Delta-isomerase [Paenibacillaceae]SHE13553.1 Isopentenyl-diphosphate delta-isomerase [Chlamydia abortus]
MSRHGGRQTEQRKAEHIDICLNRDVAGQGISTGLEAYRFRHSALPEIDFAEIRLNSSFLGKQLEAPLMISSMTGGTKEAADINRRIAEAAESRGWAMGLGSVRAAIEHPELAATFRVRDVAPSIPVLANLGAVQLNYGYGVDHCRRAVELSGADGLVLHLNSMQELFQPEGNTNFKGLLKKIEQVCRELKVPVGVKEVGWGIRGDLAQALSEAGVSFIDVAGAGGTSWSQVERYRSRDPIRSEAAAAFAGWGLPTAACIREVRSRLPEAVLIGSGGLANGVDAAKALALGADIAAFGRSVLASAVQSAESLNRLFERIEFELKAVLFGTGAATVRELKESSPLESVYA